MPLIICCVSYNMKAENNKQICKCELDTRGERRSLSEKIAKILRHHGQHKSIARANYSCINTLTVGKHHQTIHAGLALRDAQCTKWVTVDWGKICRFFRVFQVLASIVLSFSVNSPLLNDCAFFETTLVKIEKW